MAKADLSGGKNKSIKSGKRGLKRLVGILHLWMGLSSGLVICFLGITGCILAFELEIRDITEPYRHVNASREAVLPPSRLLATAEKELDGAKPGWLEYGCADAAAIAGYYKADEDGNEEIYKLVFLNPYSGEALKTKDMTIDFFRFILDGHFYLWLPPKIGQPIAASFTLIFLVMLISGIVLWRPRSKAARKQRFAIKWNASGKRLNYDIHNVLGFYVSWLAIFTVVTGLAWGFEWFAKSFYFVTSGGKTMPLHEHPVSDTALFAGQGKSSAADQVYFLLKDRVGEEEELAIYLLATKTDAIEGVINHRSGTYYNMDYYHYDQYTLKELPATGVYAGAFKDASIEDKISRMNYDVHVGAVLGLPGKILAFVVSLICASLPVTGFLIWRGKRNKKRYVPSLRNKEIIMPSLSGNSVIS